MSRYIPPPTRDYSILTPRMFRTIQKRAQPPEPDLAAEAERKRRYDRHMQTKEMSALWPNTIVRNRIDRQTRLQKEKEAEEQRQIAIDEEEKKIRKLKKQAALAEAKKAQFMDRPEVRAVNSQLLLNEVNLERQDQIALKERQRIRDMKKQMKEDEEYRKNYERMLEKENQIKRERREKAIKVAEGYRKQREDKIRQKMQEKEEDMIDDWLIAQQMKRDIEAEKREVAERRRKAREEMEDNRRKNDYLRTMKEKQQEIEELENQKLRLLAEQTMDEADRRREAEIKRKNDRLAARQKLIDIEAKRQAAQKKEQEDFLDKQLKEQYEKDSLRIAQLSARRQKYIDERKRDYQEAMASKEARERNKRDKIKGRLYPFDENNAYEDEMRKRDTERQRNLKELQQFHLQQAREKREREAAEKEREKLEFNHAIQKDQEELSKIQEYATRMLQKIQNEQNNDNSVYY